MLRGLYTAYTGMNAQQQRMDTISNNLANVNTTGYKKDGVFFESFKELYISKINDPETSANSRIGTMSFGVQIGETYVDHAQGSITQTGIVNHLAIQGDGFFVAGSLNEDGTFSEKYTRDGSFNLGPNGQLMTSDGLYVLGEEGPITVSNLNGLIISEQGDVFDGATRVGKIRMVGIEDPNKLNKLGGSLYDKTTESVEKAFEGTVMQGYLEASNVNSVEEMVNMINVMRSYESSQKVLTTYDSTLDQAVNQIGRM
ncbi:MAG: flagellar basal-body rod protein FlgF [Vallitaleaceae bacterium]|jgi:flagellar basal-body rod protein FlgF|nr:flagellar basal-body rod protein FlgF [Vallitaleaceae bacterium]